jgi:excinuclease ABC subunit A
MVNINKNIMKQNMNDSKKWITIHGAREHNLKNINVSIPKDALTVITGPSGSGKSTVALDILYAEGQRRYIESLSSYARQFLGVPAKPDVDRIDGLCPSIAIDQKTVGANPRSTVGTITEMYDHLRVLFARIGTLHCPNCHKPVTAESAESIALRLRELLNKKEVIVAAPIVIQKKGEFVHELEDCFARGFYKFMIDGRRYRFDSIDAIKKLQLKKTYHHDIDILIDTVSVVPDEWTRLHEALESAFAVANGLCKIIVGQQEVIYSSKRMCIDCAQSFPEIEPRLFSFNSPLGACKTCSGLGVVFGVGYVPSYYEFEHEHERLRETTCSTCHGKRLNDLALAITVGGLDIIQVADLSVKKALEFFKNLQLSQTERIVVERLLNELVSRYTFLLDVGLGYLTMNRSARTLSGGEGQRIRLATQIGSALSGVTYVLDEPSIGLHQRDNDRLITTLKKLRDLGNTVVVVEHDLDTMRQADYLIDMGPAAGIHGGMVVAYGTPQTIEKHETSLTGSYLTGKQFIKRQYGVRQARNFIKLKHATKHNLKDVTAYFPLNLLCGISGVSGSGKSTLVMEELVPELEKALLHRHKSITFDRIEGYEALDSLVVIDQKPIGRTPRSNPATYLGIFDEIRKLYASLPESNARGYQVGRFSFNVRQGRCSLCDGDGSITISMHFLPDVTVTCNQCKGLRYNKQTLEILYKGKNIAQVLDMTAREALDFFAVHSNIAKRLRIMCDVGLDYIKLGQPSTTLSGGEAQRIKLVDELAKRGHKTLYVLDEPTTGLHIHDIQKLMLVLNKLVEKGNSVIVIEHNVDVLRAMDYIIDMGPEGGDEGGQIIATGTPEEIALDKKSVTGKYLKR